jgi:hypothetical protein
MIRVTTPTKVTVPPPNQGWSLTPGANHFETDMPDAVAEQLAKLQTSGALKVEVLDGAAVTDWQPPTL